VDIASAIGTEEPGSNPDRVPIRCLCRGIISMLLCEVDLIRIVCVEKEK
jgi:hypothetical protein